VKCIAEHANPTEEANLWLETIPRDDPGLNLSKCNLWTARLCHEAQVLFDNNSEDEWWILKMFGVVKEAVLIDLQYQQWADSLPTPWRPRIFRKPGKTSANRFNAEATSIGLPQYVYEDCMSHGLQIIVERLVFISMRSFFIAFSSSSYILMLGLLPTLRRQE